MALFRLPPSACRRRSRSSRIGFGGTKLGRTSPIAKRKEPARRRNADERDPVRDEPDRVIAPFAPLVELLDTIPGVDMRIR